MQNTIIFGLFISLIPSVWGMGKKPYVLNNLVPKERLISDSLVENLSCETLKLETVLLAVKPSAKASDKHLPTRNWATGKGLAECWSLSHTQRLFFFMGRYDLKLDPAKPNAHNDNLELIFNSIAGKYDNSPKLFVIDDLYSTVSDLTRGIEDSRRTKRTFKDEVEAYQVWRFYQPSNASMIMGSRERPESVNASTFKDIVSSVKQGRMPIVIIRAELTAQHAVIIKSMDDSNPDFVKFTVYDSNQPYADAELEYRAKDRQFYAPGIISRFSRGSSRDPIGLFLVDEDDMSSIQKSLFKYYKSRCEQLK